LEDIKAIDIFKVRYKKMSKELNPFNRLKILTYYKEIKEILNGKMPKPRLVELFLSFTCNHKCVGCHSEDLRNDFAKYLDYEKGLKLIDELKEGGAESIEFGGGGEPLIYPKFKEFSNYVAKKGLKQGLVTNATLFNDNLMKLCLNNFTYIRIAMDGGTKETYNSIHNVDHFDKLIENIKGLVTIKKELKSSCLIGLKYLVSKKNKDDIPKAIKMAAEVGVDYIQFKAMRRDDEELNQEEMDEISKVIKKAKEEYKDHSLNVMGDVQRIKPKFQCFLSQIIPVINTNGDVFLCPFYMHRKESLKIGNVFEKSFKEVWYSEKHWEVIRNIKNEECGVFDCPVQEAMAVVDDAMIKNKMHVEFI